MNEPFAERKRRAPLLKDMIEISMRNELNLESTSEKSISKLKRKPTAKLTEDSSPQFASEKIMRNSLKKETVLKKDQVVFEQLDFLEKNAIIHDRNENIKDYLQEIIGLNKKERMEVRQIEEKMDKYSLKLNTDLKSIQDNFRKSSRNLLLDMITPNANIFAHRSEIGEGEGKKKIPMLQAISQKRMKKKYKTEVNINIKITSPKRRKLTEYDGNEGQPQLKKSCTNSILNCDKISQTKLSKNYFISDIPAAANEKKRSTTPMKKNEKTDTESMLTEISNVGLLERSPHSKSKEVDKSHHTSINETHQVVPRTKPATATSGTTGDIPKSMVINLKDQEVSRNAIITKDDHPNLKEEIFRKLLKVNQLVYDSVSDDEEEEQDFSGLIHPESLFKIHWDMIILLVILYTLIFVPLSFAFSENESLVFFILDFFSDIIFIFDVGINFYVPYLDTNNDKYEISRESIALSYLFRWFVFDFLSSIPVSTILNFLTYDTNSRHTSVPKLFFLLKLVRTIKLFKLANEKNSKQKSETSVLDNLNISSTMKMLIMFLVSFIVMNHTMACIWSFLGRLDNPNWITVLGMENENKLDIYIAALYFNLTTIYTIGYGDVKAVSFIEKVYNIFLELVGIFLYTFAESSLVYLVKTSHTNKKFEDTLFILDNMRIQYEMKSKLYSKIRRFITYKLCSSNYERFQLLEDFPNSVKNELIHCMYRDVTEKFKFFRHTNSEFNIKVIMHLKPLKSAQKDILIRSGDFVEELLFVKGGILSIEKIHRMKMIKISEIRKGEHFGEIYMLLNKQSHFDVVVKSKVAELYLLEKKNLLPICDEFHDIFDYIQKTSQLNLILFVKKMKRKMKEIDYQRKKSIHGLNNIPIAGVFEENENLQTGYGEILKSPDIINDNALLDHISEVEEEDNDELTLNGEERERTDNDCNDENEDISFHGFKLDRHSVKESSKHEEKSAEKNHQASVRETEDKDISVNSIQSIGNWNMSIDQIPEPAEARSSHIEYNSRKTMNDSHTRFSVSCLNRSMGENELKPKKNKFPKVHTMIIQPYNKLGSRSSCILRKRLAREDTSQENINHIAQRTGRKSSEMLQLKTAAYGYKNTSEKLRLHTVRVNDYIKQGSLNISNPKVFYSYVFDKWKLDDQIKRMKGLWEKINLKFKEKSEEYECE